ncbi:hypothetical protein NEOLEDRAFT_223993 [Neolentinus lepideus HHB14362 ss-1]|uniref:Uncharacterized protein n=1 Tax=Neolentinus lepideus HHB14362 ss-1 TaxID=1314782 RepID=A0A165TCT2_9AGAM|nr:hypothetical protein NEOLEDRAFT_223993 [Neolentinus lepideus HHB14362 ss-1]
MARRLEPTYPSFTLVLNEAFEPFQLPPYDSRYDGGAPPYSAASQTRFGDPLMTTLDYRFSNPDPVPTISWVMNSGTQIPMSGTCRQLWRPERATTGN